MRFPSTPSLFLCIALVAGVGCGDDDTDSPTPTADMSVPGADMVVPGAASLTVLVEPEDGIVNGIAAGDGEEDITDGWSVAFDRFLVTVGDVDIHLSSDESVDAEAEEVFVVDLTAIPGAGLALWSFDGLEAGRYEFNYATPGAGDGSMREESVTQADYDQMVAEDWTYFVDATISNPSGQSCPPADLAEVGDATPNGATNARGEACYDNPSIRFQWGVAAETTFGPCEIDEVPGFVVTEGGSQTVAISIHGDHLFFNGFPEGEEGGVTRLAQWLADSDLNLDGEVTREELEAIAPADLAELDDRYSLGGSPVELEEMWDYVIAQFKTQGHYQGEGECPFDGMAHDH